MNRCRDVICIFAGNRCSVDETRALIVFFFFFQAEDGIRDLTVTGVQTCALPIFLGDAIRRAGRLSRPAQRTGVIRMATRQEQRSTVTLRLRRTFAARPERVFRAWTTPQEMKQWTPRESWCIPGVGRASRRPQKPW